MGSLQKKNMSTLQANVFLHVMLDAKIHEKASVMKNSMTQIKDKENKKF
jgi:hypothetical protein